jgi:hypothetical protein
MIDLSQAFELLESAQTLEDLRAISRLLSAEPTAPGGTFYSNEIDPTTKSGALARSLARTLGLQTLDNTPRGQFLSSYKAFKRIVNAGSLTEADLANLRTEFLYKAGGDSLWAEASRTYAATVRGDVFALTPNAKAAIGANLGGRHDSRW